MTQKGCPHEALFSERRFEAKTDMFSCFHWDARSHPKDDVWATISRARPDWGSWHVLAAVGPEMYPGVAQKTPGMPILVFGPEIGGVLSVSLFSLARGNLASSSFHHLSRCFSSLGTFLYF